MMYLKKYKIFESEEEDIPEMIEECIDIIDTFNEFEKDFKIVNYYKGWSKNEECTRISYEQSSEDDKICISFNMCLSKDIDGSSFKSFKNPISISEIDEYTKSFIKRIGKYCDNIHFSTTNYKNIHFFLIFDNIDLSNKLNAKIDRIYKDISGFFQQTHYGSVKTISIVKYPYKNENRIKPEYTNLYNIIKNNDELSNFNINEQDSLTLRYTASVSNDSQIINVRIGPFRYKTYQSSTYKKLRLNNDQIEELIKVVENKVINFLQKDKVDVSHKGNIISIKVN